MTSRTFRTEGVGLRTPPTRTVGPNRSSYFNSNPAYTEKEPPKGTKIGWIIFWIIAAILAAIIIGIILYFVLRNNNSGSGGSGGGSGGGSTTQPIGGPCVANSNCNTGLVCNNNICKQPPRGNCNSTEDCIAGFVCAGGTCLGSAGGTCVNNEQCLGAYNCVNTICTQTICNSDADCRDGYICNLDTNVCRGGFLDSCSSPDQCQPTIPFQTNTNLGGQSFCSSIDFVCGGTAGQACADDTECAFPFLCTDNVCSYRSCVTSGDCPVSDIGTIADCIESSCVIRPGGIPSDNMSNTVTCTQPSQCDPRAFEDGAQRTCSGGVCSFYSNNNCFDYRFFGAVCVGQAGFADACPFINVCICFNDSQCPAATPFCNTLTFQCEATPPAPVTTEENKIMASLPNKSIAVNMGKKKPKPISIRRNIKNNPDESEDEEPEITSRLPQIKSSSIIPQFEDIPDNMLSRF